MKNSQEEKMNYLGAKKNLHLANLSSSTKSVDKIINYSNL